MPSWLPQLPVAEIVVVAMAFVWGSILGSFANVVLHRLPRGESVARERSRCPSCQAAIRPRDNVPVIGWMLLGGRCRACRSPIDARYPLVEAACGGIAAIIAAADLAGTAIPPLLESGRVGIDRLLLAADWRLVACWLLHSVSLIAMAVWGLLDWDRIRQGVKTAGPLPSARATCVAAAPLVLVALAAAAFVPGLGPPPLVASPTPWLGGAAERFVAAAVGLLVGRMLGAVGSRPADVCSLSLVGALGGWQAVTVTATVAAAIRPWFRRGPWQHVMVAGVATVVLATWRPATWLVKAAWNAIAAG